MAAVTTAVILEPKKRKSITTSTFFPIICHEVMGLDRASLIDHLLKNLPPMQETPVQFLGQKDLLRRRNKPPTPVFLGFPGGSVHKESTCNVGDLGSIPGLENPLEKGTATHSSLLAWRILCDCIVHGVTKKQT